MKSRFRKLRIIFLITTISLSVFSGFHIEVEKKESGSKLETKTANQAHASYQFNASGGEIVVGTAQNRLAATATAAEGVNVGSWQGLLADDGFHWGVASTASGINFQVVMNGVQLNGANQLMIQTEIDEDATAPALLVQICDWTTATGVDAAADAQCTTGGWRTLNGNKTTIAPTTTTAYHWQIYDGYFTNGTTNTTVATPLTNFINGSNEIRIRYFSTTNTTTVVHVDYARALAVINPVYQAGGFTNNTAGTVTGYYMRTSSVTQGASDNSRLQVAGTAGAAMDFYLSFKNVKTYPSMNTILVRAEYSGSTTNTALEHRPKIYNFNSSAWEDLVGADIDYSTTEVTNIFAKNNITISNYISSGEIRVGWYNMDVGTHSLLIDQIYIMLGTTNIDTADCEISFGTNSAGDCANTRNIDTTGTASTWNILTEDESNTFGHNYYALDNDADATVEEAASSHVRFQVSQPDDTAVTGLFFAGRFMSGTAGTVQLGIRDFSAAAQTTGGWSAVGATSTTALTYTDNITVGGALTGGAMGWSTNPQDHYDNINGHLRLRLRTTTSGATTNNSVNQWDFAMMSLQWIEDPNYDTATYRFNTSGGQLVTGTEQAILAATAVVANNEGTNLGSWKATIGDDGFTWGIASTTGGYNVQLIMDGVALNGANQLMIQTEFDLDATAPSTLVQICDWVTATSVDAAADAQCTTGGWRTLNGNKTAITSTTATAYHWQIYDGYFTNGSNTPISTPLTNFVNSSSEIRIRYFSTTNTTSVVHIDYARALAVINPVYQAGGFTNNTAGTVTGDYMRTNSGAHLASDNSRLQVAGTAGAAMDFYLSFKNVKTYTGMNTILVRAEYSGSTTNTALEHRPRIYNFNTPGWEDLVTADIDYSTTEVTNMFAKNNVTVSNYISNGEIRIGWYNMDVGTHSLLIDQIYIMLGTTNTDSGGCTISFGTNSAGDCTNTRNIITTETASTWNILTEDESNTFGHNYYALDNDADATVEEAAASNIQFSVTQPTNSAVTGIFFASRHMSGAAGTTVIGIRDYSAFTNAVGGWSSVTGNGTTALAYTDNIVVGGTASGGAMGWATNPEDHIDNEQNLMNIRLRTSASGATTNNSVNQWDFAMVSLQWIETEESYDQYSYRFYANNNSTDVGSPLANQDVTATLASAGDAFRLRMLTTLLSGSLWPSAASLKLQFVGKGTGTCAAPSGGTPATYTDVTGSTVIQFNDNATPADGAALTTNANDPTHSGYVIRPQTYEEANNFTNSQSRINGLKQDMLWDFSLKDNSAPSGTAYCFRIIESDGTVLSTYTQYPQITTASSSLTMSMSLSDAAIGFGTLSSSAARYATGDTLGSGTETSAHTIAVSSSGTTGYTLYVRGDTLAKGAATISAIGATPAASSPGNEQFGIRATVSGGTATVASPYNHASNYGYDATGTTQDDIGSASAASTDTFTMRYLCNISGATDAGAYSTTLTYTAVGSF